MSRNRIALLAGLALTLALAGAAWASVTGGKAPTSAGASSAVSGSVSFDGIWTGAEAKSFQAVINAFNKKFPKVKINYKPVGNNIPTVLSTAVAGGHPPDMADIAQPGLVKQFADKGALKPITYARAAIAADFAPIWLKLGTFNGKLYGIVFKASNKSLLWYNVTAFKNAGVTAPKTWAQLQKDAKTIRASGTPAYSIGGADGWTLTDLFENIYLRQSGPAKYAALTAHKIRWTDASVKAALKTMGQVVGDKGNVAGGSSGAIQTNFPTSVSNVYSSPPKAAIVFEGDFVAGVILSSTKAKPVTGFNVAPFPAIKTAADGVEVGGDTLVTFRDTPAIRAFVTFLATPDAAAAWAKLGGFATGNHKMSPSVYPDSITRRTAVPIAAAKTVVFDMSDQEPSAFGGTVGQGEWKIFQDFIKKPSNVNGIAASLEKAAKAAFKKGK
ncbi:MAG: ABC transporter substrate-binding protein [Gaiellaceae bacterium]